VRLLHWEQYATRTEAVQREQDLKTGYGRNWLDRGMAARRTRHAGEPASALLERVRAARAVAPGKRPTCKRR
jgi:predicted GIY-YIG superfamily endonuclease